jgi:hypothetical protein
MTALLPPFFMSGQDILNSMTTWGTPPGSTAQPWYWWALAATVATLYTTTHSYILLVQVVAGILEHP